MGVVLGKDEDGDDITSCVAVGDLFRSTQPKTPTGKNQRAILTSIKNKYSTLLVKSKFNMFINQIKLLKIFLTKQNPFWLNYFKKSINNINDSFKMTFSKLPTQFF